MYFTYKTSLTKDNQDEEHGGHGRRDVEHDADVMSQLIHVVHVRHQDGRHQETDGNAQLWDTRGKLMASKKYQTKLKREKSLFLIHLIWHKWFIMTARLMLFFPN